MADIIETTASIEELDVNPNPSESASHLEQKQEHGFSAEQLRADIDFAKLKQTTQQKLEEQRLEEQRRPAIVPEPNSKKVVMGQMEQIIAEVFHYKTIQQYKDKIKPEFIALFNEAEQAMLLELIELLDQYLVLQKKYVTELLQLLGYKDSDAFFADIATIPAVVSAMEAKKVFFAAIPEAHTNYSDLDVAAKVATVIGPCRMFIIPHLMQRVQEGGLVDPNVPNKILMPYLELVQQATAGLADSDLPVQLFARAHRLDAMELHYLQNKSQQHAEKRAAFARLKDYSSDHRFSTVFVKFFTNERIDGFSNIAKSLSDEWVLDTDKGEKVSARKNITDIRFNATKASITINEAVRQMSSKPIELPQDEAENLEDKKVKRRRTRRLTQRLTQIFSKEVADLFRAPVADESVKPKIFQSEPESVSPVIVPELKVTTAAKTDISVSARSELKRSASESQLKKTQSARTSSIEKLSKVLGEVAEVTATKFEPVKQAIKRFTGESIKISNAVISFSDYVHTALHNVEVFQRIGKEQKEKGEEAGAKFENWKFIYKRKADPNEDKKEKSKEEFFEGRIPKESCEGDSVEILHNGLPVCNIVAQKMSEDAKNIASGVTVTVHRHEEDDIYLAVRIMVQALAKAGRKKVIVTADLNSTEGRILALRYVKAILGQNAIPVLFDGDRELSAKETKAKIEEFAREVREKETKTKIEGPSRELSEKEAKAKAIATQRKDPYEHTAEQYEETAKKIKREQKEDAIFIKSFDKLMKMPVTTTSLFMQDPNPPQDILNIQDITTRLGNIALRRNNLTMDDYVDKLIDCLRKDPAKDYGSLTPSELNKIKQEVKAYSARKIAKKPDILNELNSAKSFMADIFNRSSRKLQDSLFVPAFDDFLRDIALTLDVAVKMEDPSTGDELDAQQILTRLAEIAFIRNGMNPEEFIDRAVAFGLATLAPSERADVTDQHMEDLKKELREKIRLHLLHKVKHRDEAVFAADLIKFAQQELLPGHVAKNSKFYSLFARLGSSCAEEYVSSQQAKKAVSQPVLVGPGHNG